MTKSAMPAARVPFTRTNHLIGRRFGRLVVLERSGSIGHDAAWHCQCDCGGRARITTKQLRETANRGGISSCGCYRKELARLNGKRTAAVDRRVMLSSERKAADAAKRTEAEAAALALARAMGIV
jgi:hypothetical protein